MDILRLTKKRAATRPRPGLTLLELVVVLGLMIALVGLLVPLLPNMLYQAHTANGATNISELQKAMTTYQACNLTYPDGYDSLLTDAGAIPSTMMWMGSSTAQAIKDAFVKYPLTPTDVKSLKAAGITQLYNMDSTSGASATFPGTVSTATTLAKDVNVIKVSPDLLMGNVQDSDGNYVTGLAPSSNIDSTATYIALGVGANCTIVGASNGGVAEAPIRGMPNGTADLNTKYGRYVVFFKLDATGSAATMIGCGCPGGSGLGTVEFLTNNYYNGSH
jgi:type II secretory pathway pseudopilin PulG